MNNLVLLYYPALLVLLFFGAKVCKKGEWNDELFSFNESKSFLGFCSIVIIFHHAAQKTCAPWLDPAKIIHGLDLFVYMGYLMVAVFLFSSGYGMFTSYKSNPDSFKHYFMKRIFPVITPLVIVWVTFFLLENLRHVTVPNPRILNVYEYIWFIPAIIYLYIIFFIAFKIIKKEIIGVLFVIAGAVAYFIFCELYSPGTWWYNTINLFPIGVLTARHKEGILKFLKKAYIPLIILSFIITFVTFIFAGYYYEILFISKVPFYSEWYQDDYHHKAELICQDISAFSFVLFTILLGMKIKTGNKVTSFLGKFTLETYLVHPLFVQLFGFAFVTAYSKPVLYIKNMFLYVAAIIILAIPLAYLLHKGINGIKDKVIKKD